MTKPSTTSVQPNLLERVIIIVPTYDEAESIGQTLDHLMQVVREITRFDVAILVFDSNSCDDTVEIVKQKQRQHSQIYLQTEPEKSGLGSAYVKAMQYACDELNADIVFEFDSDGSHQPRYLPAMLECFAKGADVVVGSRYVPGGRIPRDWAFHRKLLSVVGNFITRRLLTPSIKDFTSGFRGTRTVLLKQIKLTALLSKNYAYKIHLMWELKQLNANIVECPIEFIDRAKGYSKFPRNNMVESLLLVCRLRLQKLKRYIKVCCIGGFGALVQLICFNLFRHFFHPIYANLISMEISLVCGFILNNRISFHDARLQKTHSVLVWIKKFILFNGVGVGSAAIQTAMLWIGIDLFGRGWLPENVSLATAIVLGSVINYQIYTRFIWSAASTNP